MEASAKADVGMEQVVSELRDTHGIVNQSETISKAPAPLKRLRREPSEAGRV